MLTVLLSLMPMIGWGASDYIASRGTKQVNPFTLSFYFMLAGFLATVPIGLFFGLPAFYLHDCLFIFLASICFNTGFILMLRGFHYGPTGIVATVANSYAMVVVIYESLIGDKQFGGLVLAGVATIVLGIGMLSYTKPERNEFKSFNKTILFSLLALLIFGMAFILLRQGSNQQWYQNMLLSQTSGFVVTFLMWRAFQRRSRLSDLKQVSKKPLYFVGGAIGGLGFVGMTMAIEQADSVTIPSAISAAAPLVTAALAFVFDKEHLTMPQRIATLIIIAGIVLLAIA